MKKSLFVCAVLLGLLVLCFASCGQSGTAGKTDAQECVHSFGDWTVLSEPSCAVVGVSIRTCSLCGEVETLEAPKSTEHNFGDWETITPSACNADGVKHHVCEVCHASEDAVIPASADKHIFGAWVVTAPADCIHDGERERACSVCGTKETAVIAKTGVHDFGDWDTVKPATCAETGMKERVCSVCQTKEEKTIEKSLIHTFGDVTVTETPTYFHNGKGTHTCSVCTLTEETVVPRTGANVFVYEDFTGDTFVADNSASLSRGGLFLGSQGKGSIFQVEKIGGNDTLVYYSTLQGSDTQMNIELKSIFNNEAGKTLADLLVDGKVTVSFRAAVDATHEPDAIEFYLRDDTGASFSVLKINYQGKVTSNTLTLPTLTTTMTAYALTFDFVNNKVTGYVDGVKKGETTVNCPPSVTDLVAWARGASVYFLNGKFTPSNGYEKIMYFDDFIVIGGDFDPQIYSAQ